jgi:hypothetical protein
MISLAEVESNPALEGPHYHLLPQAQLDLLSDAEALYERGRRLRNGVCVCRNDELGWQETIRAAEQGHPVALATCYFMGKIETIRCAEKGAQMWRDSAMRGHPVCT